MLTELAESGPLVVAIDDLHWIDEESDRFVTSLARGLEGLPVLLVATARTGEPGSTGSAAVAMAEHGAVVRPAPLSVGSMARLAPTRDPVAVHRLTGGNPLLASELGLAPAETSLEDIAPSGLATLVLRRVARLSDDAVTLARTVSLFAGGATLLEAAAVTGLDQPAAAAAADGLIAAGVLRYDDGRIGFLHPLLRSAVYESLGVFARGAAHTAAARVLREHGAPDEQVAAHLLNSPGQAEAESAATLRRVATASLAAAAPRAALRYLQRAVEEPIPAGQTRVTALHELGRVQGMLRHPGAVETLRGAVAQATDARQRADVAIDLAAVLSAAVRNAEAVDTLLAIRREGLDADRRLMVDALLATTAYQINDVETFTAAVDRIPAGLPGDTPAQRLATQWLAHRLKTSGASMGEVVEMRLRGFGDDGRFAFEEFGCIYADPALPLSWLCQEDLLESVAQQRAARAVRGGRVVAHLSAELLLAWVACMRGRVTSAHERARLVMDHADATPDQRAAASEILAEALTSLRRYDEAHQVLDLPGGPHAEAPAMHRAAHALVEHRRGGPGGVEAFRAAVEHYASMGEVDPKIRWPCYWAEALARGGSADEALAVMAPYLAAAEAAGLPVSIGQAHYTLGRIHTGETAIAHFTAGAQALEATPYEWWHALLRLELGAAHRRGGARVRARGELQRVLEYADRDGEVDFAARARDELRLTGARPRSAPTTGADALTPAESRIARLAASGHSNKQIAADLFLTVGSVKVTLVRVFRKLGISSRDQLAAALAQPATRRRPASGW